MQVTFHMRAWSSRLPIATYAEFRVKAMLRTDSTFISPQVCSLSSARFSALSTRERDERSNLTASTAVHEEHRREEGCAEALENE